MALRPLTAQLAESVASELVAGAKGFVLRRNVHVALHQGASLNDETRCHHIADHVTRGGDAHRIGPVKIAFDLAENHNFTRFYMGIQTRIWADDQLGALQVNLSLDCAIDVQVFATADFTAEGVRRRKIPSRGGRGDPNLGEEIGTLNASSMDASVRR